MPERGVASTRLRESSKGEAEQRHCISRDGYADLSLTGFFKSDKVRNTRGVPGQRTLLVLSDDTRERSSGSLIGEHAARLGWRVVRATLHQVTVRGKAPFTRLFVGNCRIRPDAAVVAFAHPASITRLESIAESLDQMGVISYGIPTASLQIADDKWSTQQLAISLGLPTPATAECRLDDPRSVREAFETIGAPAWMKAKEGSGGRQVVSVGETQELEQSRQALLARISNQDALYSYPRRSDLDGVVQQHVGKSLGDETRFDYRIDLVDARMVAATRRTKPAPGQGTNLNQGAVAISALDDPLVPKMVEMARTMLTALGIERASYDFLAGNSGEIYFNEINPFPWMYLPNECALGNGLTNTTLELLEARCATQQPDLGHVAGSW